MKVALAQINQTVGDFAGNVGKILNASGKAKDQGAELVVFPELTVPGYPPMDLLLKESFIRANLEALETIRANAPDIALLVGYVDINHASGRPLHNTCAYIKDRTIVARHYKTLLPTYDVFDEDRYFEPGTTSTVVALGQFKLGLSICEDIWIESDLDLGLRRLNRYRVNPIKKLVEAGANVIVNLSASPFSQGKPAYREELFKRQAKNFGLPLLVTNQVGGNDQIIFDGSSLAIDAQGKLAARAAAFEEDLLLVELSDKGISGPIRKASEPGICEIYDALVLGIKDYLRKCGFSKTVIGLSGGIDSAVSGALAVEALGCKNVLGVAMPSPYTAPDSLSDARLLADNLGIELQVIDIQPAMRSFQAMLAAQFKGTQSGVAEENLQARIRGTLLMALANKFNYLVLSTGNKSELAVGYCTLYGDMCGGLAVISDVPKMQVYDLANYINAKAGKDLIPQNILRKAPSAELKLNQKDQDTLPPYPVLDMIVQNYVEKHLNPDEIINSGVAPDIVNDVVARIDRNEYKREQAAPGLKVSTRAFGIGWRMPIAQGFEQGGKTEALAKK